MRLTRIHVPEKLVVGQDALLPTQAGEHVTRVLRLEAGAALTLFDGLGGEYSATLSPRNGKSVRARVNEHHRVERESPLAITLLQGVARGERMDLIVQKATELGVAAIVPVLTERSVVRIDAKHSERKREHWQAIAIAACEQCGRNRIPIVAPPATLAEAIASLSDMKQRYLLRVDGECSLASRASQWRDTRAALLIGPEGGLAETEVRLAVTQGFEGCRMGPRVMRTETAGLAALAVLQAACGDLTT